MYVNHFGVKKIRIPRDFRVILAEIHTLLNSESN
jgi:hypothetical protein